QVDRQAHPDRAGTDDDDRVAGRTRRVLVGASFVVEPNLLVVDGGVGATEFAQLHFICLLRARARAGRRRLPKKIARGPSGLLLEPFVPAAAYAKRPTEPEGASAFERFPHLAIALGGPDPRIRVLRGFVVGA